MTCSYLFYLTKLPKPAYILTYRIYILLENIMDVSKTIKNLDFDIKQIDDTIDIFHHLLNGNFLSTNGQQTIDRNMKELWNVQHHLLALRAELLRERQQPNHEH